MYGTVDKMVAEIYEVTLESEAVSGYKVQVECINAEKGILTYLPNPRVSEFKMRNSGFQGIRLCEEETITESMPVHIILSVSDVQRIRTSRNRILGTDPDTESGAEFTMLGWTLLGGKPNTATSTQQFLFATTLQGEF